MLAEAINHFDRKDEALAQLTLAVRGQPEVDAHWARLYQQSVALDSYHAMREELDSAIDAHRASSPAPRAVLASMMQWRARLLEAVYDDADAAAQDYEDARRFAPRDVVLWGRYAGFASRNDRLSEFQDAVVSAHKAVKRGRLPKAIDALAAAWSSEPRNFTQAAQLLSAAAQAPVGDGDTVGGAARFGWAADLLLQEIQAARPDPTKTGPILHRLGLVYRAIRNHGQAAVLFGAASGLLEAPEKTQSQQYWAEALVQTGQDEEAVLILRRAVKATPSLHALRLSLARILTRSGSIAEARTEYEHLLHMTTLSVNDREQLQRELAALPK
jgi:tetratricopeptide (TPR) repeat protein